MKDNKVDVEGVGEVQVETQEVDKEIKVIIPEAVQEAGAEAVEKFKTAVSEKDKTVGDLYKQKMEWNKKQEERNRIAKEKETELNKLKTETQRLKREKEKFEASERVKKDVPNTKDLFLKKLGKKSVTQGEYLDLKDDNPELFDEASDERQAMLITNAQTFNAERTHQDMQKKMIENQIRNDGFNISEVEDYMRKWEFKSLEKAFAMFKAQNKPKKAKSPIDAINDAEEKKNKTITFIGAGDAKPKKSLADLSEKEINQLPYDHPMKVAWREERGL